MLHTRIFTPTLFFEAKEAKKGKKTPTDSPPRKKNYTQSIELNFLPRSQDNPPISRSISLSSIFRISLDLKNNKKVPNSLERKRKRNADDENSAGKKAALVKREKTSQAHTYFPYKQHIFHHPHSPALQNDRQKSVFYDCRAPPPPQSPPKTLKGISTEACYTPLYNC